MARYVSRRENKTSESSLPSHSGTSMHGTCQPYSWPLGPTGNCVSNWPTELQLTNEGVGQIGGDQPRWAMMHGFQSDEGARGPQFRQCSPHMSPEVWVGVQVVGLMLLAPGHAIPLLP
jgi:hypothetical protein